MTLTDDLPTDSVLRRHAIAERNRILGLPPGDSVLRRHHEQLQSILPGAARASAPSRVRAMPAASIQAAVPAPAAPVPRPAAPSASAATLPPASRPATGGLLGWLRRLLGA